MKKKQFSGSNLEPASMHGYRHEANRVSNIDDWYSGLKNPFTNTFTRKQQELVIAHIPYKTKRFERK